MMRHHWKEIIAAISVACFVALAGQAGAAESWAQVADKVEKNQAKTVSQAADTEEIIVKDRETLLGELNGLKAEEKKEDKALARLQKQFQNLLKVEEKLNQELADEQEEIEAVEGTVRASAKEASSLSRDNPITPEFPERVAAITKLLQSRRFPGLEGIASLVGVFFQEMAASGTVVRRTGEFVGPDGRNATGEILRVGRFTTYYRLPDGSVGFLTPEESGERLIAIQGDVPRGMKADIRAYLDNDSAELPVDPSGGGAAFAKFGSGRTFGEWIETGGLLMYPILIVGIVAFLLGVYRLFDLLFKRKASEQIMDRINDMVTKDLWTEAQEFCTTNSKKVPTCSMLEGVMSNAGTSYEVLQSALDESILRQTTKLERFLPTLSILAMISPLLGLLGTVTGMINTFQVITMVGTGDPRMMSGGISEALFTTQFGLMVAVPIMLLHHFLERQVQGITSDMDEKGYGFIVTMMKSNGAEA